jgi:type IV secretion system protein TrbC
MLFNRARRAFATAWTFAFMALATAPAYAAGSNMPWEQPLNQILESIQGPVAKVISVIVIIVTGLTLAFGETSGGFQAQDPGTPVPKRGVTLGAAPAAGDPPVARWSVRARRPSPRASSAASLPGWWCRHGAPVMIARQIGCEL